MNARLLTLGLACAACLSTAASLPPSDASPTPDCPEAKKGNPVFDFESLTDPDEKNQILDFHKSFDLGKTGPPRWGYSKVGVSKIGEEDKRSEGEHFKHFDHPRVQPRPDDPKWRTYCKVPNKDLKEPKRHAVPHACRPEDENWLNVPKKAEAAATDPAACKPDLGKTYKFRSLPVVKAPPKIRVTYVHTPEGIFPRLDPFKHPPGTNMLPTVYSDVSDGDKCIVPNSLPSSVSKVYNLHDGDPVVTPINARSPTNDLQEVLDTTYTLLTGSSPKRLWERLDREHYEDMLRDLAKRKEEIKANRPRIRRYLNMAIDIIEGKPVADRAYSGFPLLHHSGQDRIRRVMPILGKAPYAPPPGVGPKRYISPAEAAANEAPDPKAKPTADVDPRVPNVVGGNAQVHQVWYDGRIESDTMFYDWQGEYDGCEVRVIRPAQGVPAIPTEGRNLMVVSDAGGKRHFLLFDRKGKLILTADESKYTKKAKEIAHLTAQLAKLKAGPEPKLDRERQSAIAAAVAAIVDVPFATKCAEELNLPPIPPNVPWTVTYTIDVLDRGRDDFATTTMFFDSHNATEAFYKEKEKGKGQAPELERNQFRTRVLDVRRLSFDGTKLPEPVLHPQLPLVSMDQTFFPMDSGTRTVLTVKMPPPEYHNLTYTWGWRVHPPRAQATEDAAKRKFGEKQKSSIVEYEREAFGNDPVKAIDRLGDLAPSKRMWRAFHHVLTALDGIDPEKDGIDQEKDEKIKRQKEEKSKESLIDCLTQILDARNAFLDWKDRNHLPSGLQPDPESDLTVLFVNNTTYGHLRDHGWVDMTKWRDRVHGNMIQVTLINADYFPHQYLNIEWGGNRGWEPQFKPTLPLAGSGTFFSFGRFHYQYNTPPGKIEVAAAVRLRKNGTPIENSHPDANCVPDVVLPGVHRLWINMHHEPSRRLRFYQFDPTHHDQAIYSMH